MKLITTILLAASLAGCASDGSFDTGAALMVLGAGLTGYANGVGEVYEDPQTCVTYPAIGPYGLETVQCY